jgi:Holliday junction resolvase YEN1
LLGLAIQPIFVFDGPNKPAFKRNKRSGRGDGVATAMAKRLIRLFGFAMHDAPGEAEAECALLEREGIVDAVLSEDVDTIMFGCRRTLRNWSAEGKGGSKTPTHVSVYDAASVTAGGLDREGMVLVALMSGGDYLPEGVPGCGVKVACQAAKAGFGRDLCRLKRADMDGLKAWKQRLLHELRTNETGYFRTRHKALDIPDDFPNMEIVRYYTHPVVSRQTTIDRLKAEFPTTAKVDTIGLRDFARETFDWTFRIGAIKLIRVLAPSLLVQCFLERCKTAERHDDLDLQQKEESALVKAISSRRTHFSTDATPELRISFIPADIVKLDLTAEPEEELQEFGRTGLALNSDDESEVAPDEPGGRPKTGPKKPFDPLQPDSVWVPETLTKLGVPLTVEDWEGNQRTKKQLKEQQAAAKARKPRTKKSDMPAGALDKYVKVVKRVGESAKDTPGSGIDSPLPSSIPVSSQATPKASSKKAEQSLIKPTKSVNPWTLASSQAKEPIVISSSPVAPTSPPRASAGNIASQATPTRQKRSKSPRAEESSSSPLFGLSPSPGKSPSTSRLPTESTGVSGRAATKARPFKRVKSGAEDKIGTTTTSNQPQPRAPTQRSLKDYGRILKNSSALQATAKSTVANSQIPIEISTDDEGSPLTQQPSSQPAALSPVPSRLPTAPPLDRIGILDAEDPFGQLSPPTKTISKLPRASQDDTPTSSHRGSMSPERQQRYQTKGNGPDIFSTSTSTFTPTDDADGEDTVGTHQQQAVTTATTRTSTTSSSTSASSNKPANKSNKGTGTTKLYIPRTSLTGVGFFKEVEVTRDEADRFLAPAEDNKTTTDGRDDKFTSTLSLDGGGGGGGGQGRGRGRGGGGGGGKRIWRLSEVEVFDLTGED